MRREKETKERERLNEGRKEGLITNRGVSERCEKGRME